MKRLWKEINKPVKVNKNFAIWLIYVVFSILYMSCTQKDNDMRSSESQTEIENGNERWDTAERKETSIKLPSGFYYDSMMKTTNAEDDYNDRLDEYFDDPEDELQFDPEIFDFQDD